MGLDVERYPNNEKNGALEKNTFKKIIDKAKNILFYDHNWNCRFMKYIV